MADPWDELADGLERRQATTADPWGALADDLEAKADARTREAESARRIHLGEDIRSRETKSVGKLMAKGLWATPMPGTVPMAEFDPDVMEAIEHARRMGVPTAPEPGADPGDEPSFLEKALATERSGALAGMLGPVLQPFAHVALEARQIFKQTFAPPGTTVRTPTWLSTVFDTAETLARVGIAAPVLAWSEGRGDDVFEYMGKAIPLPTWQPGEVPRDNFAAYQSFVKHKLGGDPSDWKHIAGGFAFSLIDPAMALSGPVGGAKKALNAAKQAALLTGSLKNVGWARNFMRGAGIVGKELDTQTAVLAQHIMGDIQEAGSVRGARDAVRARLVGMFGDEAGTKLDDLGEAWGETGLRIGLPFTPRREIVSARTLRRGQELGVAGLAKVKPFAALDVAQDLASKVGLAKPPLIKERKSALDAINGVLRYFRTDLEGGFKDWDGALDFYEASRIVKDPFEHQSRLSISQLAQVARKLTSAPGGRKGIPDPFHMGLGELVDYAKNPGLAQEAERQFGQAVLNSPYRATSQRLEEGVFNVVDIAVDDLEGMNILRRGYANAVIRGRKLGHDASEVAAEYHRYVANALRKGPKGMAEDVADGVATQAWMQAEGPLAQDSALYGELMESLSDRVALMLKHNQGQLDQMLMGERKIFENYAKQAAKRAGNAARRGGADNKAADAVAKDAYNRVFGKAPDEIENYFMHFIRDRNMIRRRVEASGGGAGAGSNAERRTFLDVVENFEAGQNPTDDLMQSLAARTYSHIRFKEKAAAADLVFSDTRWARHGEFKGKTQDGWGEMSHPITGETYTVRNEVQDYLTRAVSFHDPDALPKFLKYYDGAMGRWKSYATHARVVFYNIRNWVDDGWRMHMAGFNFNPKTFEESMRIGMLGSLEADLPVRQTVRALRKPTKAGSVRDKGRKYWDQRQDAKAKHLREDVAKRTILTADGRKITYQDAWNEAVRTGVVDKSFVSADLANDLPDGMDFAKQYSPGEMAFKTLTFWTKDHPVFGTHGFLLQATGNIARWNENMRRMTLFVDRLKAGEAVEDAARAVKTWLFDYKDLTKFEKEWMRRVMPFYTFARKNLPAQVKAMLANPGKYLAVSKAKRAVEAKAETDAYVFKGELTSPSTWGIEHREAGPIGAVRDYMDDLWAWRLPIQTPEGSPVFWNIGLSMTDVNILNGAMPGTGSGQPEIFDRMTPMLDIGKLIVAVGDKYDFKSPFSGRSIKGSYMEPDPGLKQILELPGIYNKWAKANGQPTVPNPLIRMPTLAGQTFPAIPTAVVLAYRKLFPHLVAYGRVFSQEREDPFQKEQASFRRIRELLGASFMVNNPLRAEPEKLRELKEGGLAVVARNPLGIIPGD